MSKLQLLNEVLDEKLAAVPLEISVVVKTTIAEYQGEISRLKRAVARLRRLLDLVFKPEIKLQRLAGLESESTSDYEPPSEVSPDSDNSENGNVDGVESRIPLSGLKPLKSKRGRGRPRKGTSELPDLKCDKKNCEFPDLKCDVCGKCFEKARNLQRHRQYRHSEERRHMCDTCGKCFIRKDHMTQHMKLHTEEKKHCCTECGKCFLHKSILKNHMGTHTGEAFKCDVCGKCMTTAGGLKVMSKQLEHHMKDLTQHRLVHALERPFKCLTCGKGFTSRAALMGHERIHTGEKPHSCAECGKSYRLSYDLSIHMRRHTGERPHLCSECGKSFITKSSLENHKVIHTGEKPFKCETCGAAFGHKANLQRHQVLHTGERPYKCKVCGKNVVYF
uniref:C2H2-type domain-containing protein n=1 Tax=Oncorhynchus tshawytscha TaxID=74940 RepID=A0AAZ3SUU2_ONCTS